MLDGFHLINVCKITESPETVIVIFDPSILCFMSWWAMCVVDPCVYLGKSVMSPSALL